jgi:lipid II:glycine glycyltransferase (peptidoglycan interpeptide bridge formation enzyme)
MEYFQSIRADIIIPATTNTIFRTYPNGAVVAPYGTLIIDLDQPEETLWGNVHSKHRNVIRNAAKKGVQIHSGTEHSQTAYKLIMDTFKRSKLPFMDKDAFMKMIVGLGPSVKVFIADYQGEVQGSAVLPFSNYSAYYVYGGSVPEPLTGAMNLLQWEAIRHFRNLGVKHYDFCGVRIDPDKGSKQAGLKMFKERFGPRFVKGYMWKYSLNPLKSSIYSLAVRLFRGGDIVDAERHKLNSPGTGNT